MDDKSRKIAAHGSSNPDVSIAAPVEAVPFSGVNAPPNKQLRCLETFPPDSGHVKIKPLYNGRESLAELQARDELFRAALPLGDIMAFELRLREGVYLVDERMPLAVGYTLTDIPPGMPVTSWWAGLVHPDHRCHLWERHDNLVLGASERLDVEYPVRHRSGKWLWFRSVAKALGRDALGRAVRIAGFVTNVDAARRREEGVRVSLRELEEQHTQLKDALRQQRQAFKRADKELAKRQKEVADLNARLRILQLRLEVGRPAPDADSALAGNLAHLFVPSLEALRQKETRREARELIEAMLRQATDLCAAVSPMLRSHYAALTPREAQIADLIRIGNDSKAIALMLGISLRSVETHRFHIRKKLKLDASRVTLRNYLNLLT